MDREGFFKYLRKGGRTEDVAKRVIRLVDTFAEYLKNYANTNLDAATREDLDAFVGWVDEQGKSLPKDDEIHPSAKSFLWAIRYYYRFTSNNDMASHSGSLRKNRITRKPFTLKDFLGVDQDHIRALKANKITNVEEMLKSGATADLRRKLSELTGVPESAIAELVRLSDLARITGIKAIRARLYHDAGIGSIKKMAAMSQDEILEISRKFVEATGFDGIPPLPGEVEFSIDRAKTLPIVTDLD